MLTHKHTHTLTYSNAAYHHQPPAYLLPPMMVPLAAVLSPRSQSSPPCSPASRSTHVNTTDFFGVANLTCVQRTNSYGSHPWNHRVQQSRLAPGTSAPFFRLGSASSCNPPSRLTSSSSAATHQPAQPFSRSGRPTLPKFTGTSPAPATGQALVFLAPTPPAHNNGLREGRNPFTVDATAQGIHGQDVGAIFPRVNSTALSYPMQRASPTRYSEAPSDATSHFLPPRPMLELQRQTLPLPPTQNCSRSPSLRVVFASMEPASGCLQSDGVHEPVPSAHMRPTFPASAAVGSREDTLQRYPQMPGAPLTRTRSLSPISPASRKLDMGMSESRASHAHDAKPVRFNPAGADYNTTTHLLNAVPSWPHSSAVMARASLPGGTAALEQRTSSCASAPMSSGRRLCDPESESPWSQSSRPVQRTASSPAAPHTPRVLPVQRVKSLTTQPQPARAGSADQVLSAKLHASSFDSHHHQGMHSASEGPPDAMKVAATSLANKGPAGKGVIVFSDTDDYDALVQRIAIAGSNSPQGIRSGCSDIDSNQRGGMCEAQHVGNESSGGESKAAAGSHSISAASIGYAVLYLLLTWQSCGVHLRIFAQFIFKFAPKLHIKARIHILPRTQNIRCIPMYLCTLYRNITFNHAVTPISMRTH
jgi:hypothetical protein